MRVCNGYVFATVCVCSHEMHVVDLAVRVVDSSIGFVDWIRRLDLRVVDLLMRAVELSMRVVDLCMGTVDRCVSWIC